MSESIGELYDSLAPHGRTTRTAHGRTWIITRLPSERTLPAWHVTPDERLTTPKVWCNRCMDWCTSGNLCDCCDLEPVQP